MYPGLEHAVYTPEDSLCVGGFFLNPANITLSMGVVHHLQLHPEHTNDEPVLQILKVYERYYRGLTIRSDRSRFQHEDIEMFAWKLEEFLNGSARSETEDEWLEAREAFTTQARKEKWVDNVLKIAKELKRAL